MRLKIAHQPARKAAPYGLIVSKPYCASLPLQQPHCLAPKQPELCKAANSSEELNAAKKAAQDQQLEASRCPSLIFAFIFSSC